MISCKQINNKKALFGKIDDLAWACTIYRRLLSHFFLGGFRHKCDQAYSFFCFICS